MRAKLRDFFKHDAQTAYSGGKARAPLQRPGLRARLAVLAAGMMLFAGTALMTPAYAQDVPEKPVAAAQVEPGTAQQNGVTNTSPDNFERDVVTASYDGPVLLYIHAPGCDYCERYGPVLEMEADIADDVTLVKLNVDEHPEFTWGTFKEMQGVPYVAVFAHGLLIDTSAGAPPEGREFEAAQAVVGYAAQVWRIVGDQLEKDAPDANARTKTPKQARKSATRAGM